MSGAVDIVARARRAAARIADERVGSLLGELLARITVSSRDDAASAQIRSLSTGRAQMEVSPAFVREHVHTDDDALYVVCHELLHKVRGDLVSFVVRNAWPHRAVNVALDIFVNAHLARLCFAESPPLVRRLYGARTLASAPLLPPMDLAARESRRDPAWREFARRHDELVRHVRVDPTARARLASLTERAFTEMGAWHPRRLASLYLRGWLDEVPFEGFLDDLARVLLDEHPELALESELVLLGEHDWSGRAVFWKDAWRRLQTRWPGAFEDDVADERVDAVADRSCREFYEAVRAALTFARDPHVQSALVVERGVLAFPGRRESVLMACGIVPVFFPTVVTSRAEAEEQVHVYLDVSGSTEMYQRLMYGLTIHLGETIGPRVFLFSNRVEPMSMRDLAAGRSRTTGGTDFDCVFRHALEQRFRRILLVTDGFALLEDELRDRARREGLRAFVVLTEPMQWGREAVEAFAERTWVLPEGLRASP